jgi:hypothetical protein
MKFLKSKFIKFSILLLLVNCVEPVDIKTITYENYLVVEAIITNENKNHQIRLSRTFEIDSNTPAPETGATVQVISDTATYNFIETSNGNYVSNVAFSAEEGEIYQLNITTKDGNSYSYSQEILTALSQIEKLTTEIETSTEGLKGVSIIVHSFNPNNDANYYRYQYEETQKISPPFWSNEELVVISDGKVEVVTRTINNKDCYKTTSSTEILLTNTKTLLEDRVQFPVRFILDTDFIISNRYSILVKQYVQSFAVYNYYNTLKKLSSSESVFNQSQPGFIAGNIRSEKDKNENVIGYFEVSSVSKKRIFFSYNDIFPNKNSVFPSSCDFVAPIFYDAFSKLYTLTDLIKAGTHSYFKENNTGSPYLEGKYLLVPKICGDCTVLGSNIKPNFWVD